MAATFHHEVFTTMSKPSSGALLPVITPKVEECFFPARSLVRSGSTRNTRSDAMMPRGRERTGIGVRPSQRGRYPGWESHASGPAAQVACSPMICVTSRRSSRVVVSGVSVQASHSSATPGSSWSPLKEPR